SFVRERLRPVKPGEAMSTSSDRRLRWGVLAGVVAMSLFTVLFVVLLRRDWAIGQAVDRLQPGMTEAEVQQVLKGVRHAKLATPEGDPAYLFYGTDEFVTVVLHDEDGTPRVVRVEHAPDDGPGWDRMRRRWENRLR